METLLTLAKYNQWMNNSLYDKCIELGQSNIEKEQGALVTASYRTIP